MAESDAIVINYRPRRQFIPFHDRSQRWACIVAHRRAGKTTACIHELQRGALRCGSERARFAYVSPFRSQSKAVAWDICRAAFDPLRVIGATANESELRIDYPNGGQVRLHGADNPDSLRGIGLDGVVLDEYSQCDPRVWTEILRPALSDRKGWAVFIGTPRGHNAFYDIWTDATKSADWFTLRLKASETGILPEDELAIMRAQMSEEEYAQEYETSFEAAIVGAYWGKLMSQADADKRITAVPYDPAARVSTAWDIGITDPTAIWFWQEVGREIHLIDYVEQSGADIGQFVKLLESKPYLYEDHVFPHDAWGTEKQTGMSTVEFIESNLKLKGIKRAPTHRVEDGIAAVSTLLPRCWFDAGRCAHGIEVLKMYRSEYSTKLETLKPAPIHDWASHGADAMRYLAMYLARGRGTKGFGRKIEYPDWGAI